MSQQKIRISTSFQTHQKLHTEESHLIHNLWIIRNELGSWLEMTPSNLVFATITVISGHSAELTTISHIYMKVIELVVVRPTAIFISLKWDFEKVDFRNWIHVLKIQLLCLLVFRKWPKWGQRRKYNKS